MIEITRALARQLRAVLRKAVTLGAGRAPRPPLLLHADGEGLRVRAQFPEVAVEFHVPGARAPATLTLPAEALDACEGRKEDSVVLESAKEGSLQVRWHDAGVPQVREFVAPDAEQLPPFPEEPLQLFPIAPAFLAALDAAAHIAAREGTRFAMQKLQLRGSTGDIVATDGKQLLIQGGFALPWKEDVLIPALGVFGCRELPQDVPVALGKSEQHVCLRVGRWTFHLSIDRDGRFPRTETVLPAATASATTCRLTMEDAAFLGKVLPRLPGRDDDQALLTLDLNGHVAVRAKSEEQSQVTEVVLARSTVVGPPVRFVSNRQYLARAVQFGFTELRVTRPDVPVVCSDKYRTYLWMILGQDGALLPTDDVLRITSAGDQPAPVPPRKERSILPMTKPSSTPEPSNGPTLPRPSEESRAANGTGLGALIVEAQSLKEVLHDAYGRTARLLAALKRHKQQSRLVQSTLASLKQLQQIDG